MATQVFTDEELERLRGFPEIGRDELVRFFTLTAADRAFVDPGRGRGAADQLGVAVALCTLPWLGFVPDTVAAAPAVAVSRLAEQLDLDPTTLRSYGRRAKTRTDHLRLVAQYLGWRPAAELEFKELDEFLLARAMEHDSPTLLFRLAGEYLVSAKVIRAPRRRRRPGPHQPRPLGEHQLLRRDRGRHRRRTRRSRPHRVPATTRARHPLLTPVGHCPGAATTSPASGTSSRRSAR